MLTDAILSQLDCHIAVPADYVKRKASPQIFDTSDDRRRFPRKSCRVDGVLQYRSTYPWLRRSNRYQKILIRDISRGGVGFLHSEEMYPDENARFVFLNGTERGLTVKRCRRIGPRCYEIGAEFDEPLNDLTDGSWR